MVNKLKNVINVNFELFTWGDFMVKSIAILTPFACLVTTFES